MGEATCCRVGTGQARARSLLIRRSIRGCEKDLRRRKKAAGWTAVKLKNTTATVGSRSPNIARAMLLIHTGFGYGMNYFGAK